LVLANFFVHYELEENALLSWFHADLGDTHTHTLAIGKEFCGFALWRPNREGFWGIIVFQTTECSGPFFRM
jgi:hypothetical protein